VLIEKKRYELEHRPVQKQVCCTTCMLPLLRQGTTAQFYGASCACLSAGLLTSLVNMLNA
jgi:hypothetical protein